MDEWVVCDVWNVCGGKLLLNFHLMCVTIISIVLLVLNTIK